MRRLVVLAAVVAALAGVGVATAAPSSGTSTAHGSGATLLNTFSFDVRAPVGRPSEASGHVDASPTGLKGIQDNNGDAVCLDVRGNAFGLIYRYDDTAELGPLPGKGLYLYVTGIDGGPGRVDLAGIGGPPAPFDPKLGCAPNPALNNFGPVVRGDFVVRDGRVAG